MRGIVICDFSAVTVNAYHYIDVHSDTAEAIGEVG